MAALAWLLAHSGQIKKLLDLLPTLAADACGAPDRGGPQRRGQGTIDGLIARLEAVAAPMAEPTPGVPEPTQDTAAEPDVAPETALASVAAPASLADGTVVVVRGGRLVPQTT